jgi:hypothetical protein
VPARRGRPCVQKRRTSSPSGSLASKPGLTTWNPTGRMLPSTTAPPFSFLSDRTRATLLQPPPPPQLPALQLTARHQDPAPAQAPCPHGRRWDDANVHHEQKLVGRWTESEMDEFVNDMGSVMRREFDIWVEQCWSVTRMRRLKHAC